MLWPGGIYIVREASNVLGINLNGKENTVIYFSIFGKNVIIIN